MRAFNHNAKPRYIGGALAFALLLSACSTTSALELKVGNCLDLPNDTEMSAGFELTTVKTVSCSSEHEAQVYAEKELTGNEFPGTDAIQDIAAEFCTEEFKTFVGSEIGTSTLDIYPLMPTAESWEQAGDRTLLCVAISPTPVTTTFENSKL